MILVNTDYIAGKELEMLGLVNGSTIQSKNIGRDFGAGLKSIVGGKRDCHEAYGGKCRRNGCRCGC